jgi:two-component system response regulator GlrR
MQCRAEPHLATDQAREKHKTGHRRQCYQSMSFLRCGLVDLDGSPTATAAARTALAEQADLSLVACNEEPDAVVVIAVGVAFTAARQRIVDLRAQWPACAVLVVCDPGGAEQMQAWLAAGASDFVAAAGTRCELLARLRRALGLRSSALPSAGCFPAEAAATPHIDLQLRGFVGTAPQFVRQIARLPAIAGCDAGVLILGETGTGKEVCAQAVHHLSARAARPWVAINCGAVPTELLESELFGHVRGAFTNAHASRTGLVAEAEGGTLFLDDVDCLPLAAQSKLLRFLEEREYRQVGANTVRRADVRVIAASNRRLDELAARGVFRADLYYRLNVLSLELPPLRARRGDVPTLALHFALHCARQAGRAVPELTPAALRRLMAHDWPGNVRELKHVIERAVLLAVAPTLGPADFDLGVTHALPADEDSFQAAKARLVADFERGYIEHLLSSHQGNVTRAAQAARKNRRAFFELMRKHQIASARFRLLQS